MKRSLFKLAAAAAFLAVSAAWAADDTVKQGVGAQSPGRAAHDVKKEQQGEKDKLHTSGETDKPGRAAHDGRAEDVNRPDAEHAMTDPQAGAAPGRADHATQERAKKEQAQ